MYGGNAENAVDADVQDILRRSFSPLDACILSSMATVCKLFLMRWCISRTTAAFVTSRAFSIASAV